MFDFVAQSNLTKLATVLMWQSCDFQLVEIFSPRLASFIGELKAVAMQQDMWPMQCADVLSICEESDSDKPGFLPSHSSFAVTFVTIEIVIKPPYEWSF